MWESVRAWWFAARIVWVLRPRGPRALRRLQRRAAATPMMWTELQKAGNLMVRAIVGD